MPNLPYNIALRALARFIKTWPESQEQADTVSVSVQGWTWVKIVGLTEDSWEFQDEAEQSIAKSDWEVTPKKQFHGPLWM